MSTKKELTEWFETILSDLEDGNESYLKDEINELSKVLKENIGKEIK